MALTTGHLVFLVPPWAATGLGPFLAGTEAFGKLLGWRSQLGTACLIVDKADFTKQQVPAAQGGGRENGGAGLRSL
jgi:carotenoid cleavage dioxygenase-like enzyme